VAELVSDLSRRLPGALENRRGGLPERVSGHPLELVGKRAHAGQLRELDQRCPVGSAQTISIGKDHCLFGRQSDPPCLDQADSGFAPAEFGDDLVLREARVASVVAKHTAQLLPSLTSDRPA
jgi:hypothetical protein